MGFGSRRSLIRPRRSRPPAPGREPLAETKRFFSQLAGVPKELGLGRKSVSKPVPPAGKPVVQAKPVIKSVELVPADEVGQDMNESLKAGDSVRVRGKPGIVAGHSQAGNLLIRPAPMDLTDRSNRPRGDGPDHGPADEGDMEKEDA